MWSGIGAALSSVGGSIIGSIIDRSTANSQARKQFNREQLLMDKSFAKDVEMWNMQNEYNSPKAQMERLQKAGLNPNLMYSNGNVGNATSMPTMTKGTASKGDTTKFNIDFGKLMPLMQMENLNAQNKLISAQTVEAEERAKGVTLDNIRKGIDNEYLPQRYAKEIDMMGRNHDPVNRVVNGALDFGNGLINSLSTYVKNNPNVIPRIVNNNPKKEKPVSNKKQNEWSWFTE